jgi:hypothetical protein
MVSMLFSLFNILLNSLYGNILARKLHKLNTKACQPYRLTGYLWFNYQSFNLPANQIYGVFAEFENQLLYKLWKFSLGSEFPYINRLTTIKSFQLVVYPGLLLLCLIFHGCVIPSAATVNIFFPISVLI